MKGRTPVRQNALAFWTPKAGRRPENRPKAIRVNLSGRATNQKMGSHRAPFLIESAPDEGEDSCSTKRVSVLDAEGGPQARESPQGDSSQSRRVRRILKVSRSSLLAPCYLPTLLSVLWRISMRFGVSVLPRLTMASAALMSSSMAGPQLNQGDFAA